MSTEEVIDIEGFDKLYSALDEERFLYMWISKNRELAIIKTFWNDYKLIPFSKNIENKFYEKMSPPVGNLEFILEKVKEYNATDKNK